jgi:hypothetical protein
MGPKKTQHERQLAKKASSSSTSSASSAPSPSDNTDTVSHELKSRVVIEIPRTTYNEMMDVRRDVMQVLVSWKDPKVEDGTMVMCGIPLVLYHAGMTRDDYFGGDVIHAFHNRKGEYGPAN